MIMIKPQTIQIFLPDGSPTSIREAEVTNRLVKAILFPRNKMKEVVKREGVHHTGIYFLFGYKEDGNTPLVYIGEGEECFKRIKNHNRSKDFWTHAIVVTTKTNEWTKTDAKFLEHYCLEKAEKIGRYKTDNDTGSKQPSLSESRIYDLLDNFETLKGLLGTLGYPLFEERRKSKELFYCKGRGVEASGELTDDGFLVYKGSTCSALETKSAQTWILNLRKKLIDQKILQQENGHYKFNKDQIFNSPSAAAATVLGRSSNGWTRWKDIEGKTLDELKRN